MTDPRVVQARVDVADGSTVFEDVTVPVRALPTGRALSELWATDRLLMEFDGPPTAVHGPFPSVNGARLWRLVVPPDAPDAVPPFHATATIDLGFVLCGRVSLELENGSTADLSPGDSFVQRGAAHRWRNNGPDDAVLGVAVIGTSGAGGHA